MIRPTSRGLWTVFQIDTRGNRLAVSFMRDFDDAICEALDVAIELGGGAVELRGPRGEWYRLDLARMNSIVAESQLAAARTVKLC